jgi:hypothetical protein
MAIGRSEIRTRITMHPPPHVVERAFREAGVEYGDWRRAWPAAAKAMQDGIGRAVRSRGASIDRQWPRPSARYARRKLREGYGSDRMTRTGWTMVALMSTIGSSRGVRMSRRSVSVGVTGPLAERLGALQFKRGYWTIGWDDTARQGVTNAVNAYVNEIIGRVRAKVNG